MLNQVYTVLKSNSRKGDFFALVQKDKNKQEIELNDEEVKTFQKKLERNILNIKKKLYLKC